MQKTLLGSIHGRFQCFHKEHAEYLHSALARCEHLIIGITNAIETDSSNRKRLLPEHNPLSYNQRFVVLNEYMRCNSIPAHLYSIVPFPIEDTELLRRIVSVETVCYTTVNDQWNQEKIELLRQAGYEVEILYTREKMIKGTEIRKNIRIGGNQWKKDVPSELHDVYRRVVLPALSGE